MRYNIHYNGTLSYDEGMKAIQRSVRDDYTSILPLYPVSNHDAAKAATSQMDRTIEKCRKSIKLHSIKAKPKVDPKKKSDPKYREWLKSEEFNPAMGDVWVRLAEAEFHKGDFEGAAATLAYIERHYSNNPDMVARCLLLKARAFSELGWMYEAEDALRRANPDDLAPKNAHYYAAAQADVLMKGEHYHEAIPFIRIALPYEKRRFNRPRFYFVLAQLYEREGKKADAIEAYKHCIRLTPGEEMEFNAKLHQAELRGRKSIPSLQRLAKLEKYKERLDVIHSTIGNICLAARDTTRALESYETAIENSTGGKIKASILLHTAGLYFRMREYAKAQPHYTEAMNLITPDYPDYRMLSQRTEVLSELIQHTTTITLQDSLQHLSSLSPEEQMKVAEALVAALLEQERQDSVAQAEQTRRAELDARDGSNSVNTFGMPGGAQSQDFYFYNDNLVQQGKSQFRKLWGTRALEDNWRRKNKIMSAPEMDFQSEESGSEEPEPLVSDSIAGDSAGVGVTLSGDSIGARSSMKMEEGADDPHNPAYYLRQIPRTEEELHASDSLIADAFYALIPLYETRLCDTVMAVATMAEFRRRFPLDPRIAEMDRIDSIRRRVATDPAYVAEQLHLLHGADTLYVRAYNAYTRAEYNKVKDCKLEAERAFPETRLMPRFLFLNAVAVARTEGQTAFVECLREMVGRYPESELGTMAKDMLAMMGQGMESQMGSMANRPVEMGEMESEDELALLAEAESSPVLVLTPANGVGVNDLLYEVALFNFSNFMVREFDLMVQGRQLIISGFESQADIEWYLDLIRRTAPDILKKAAPLDGLSG